MAKTKRYTTYCDQCYSWGKSGLGLRAAGMECTSHGKAYGHSAHMLEETPESRARAKALSAPVPPRTADRDNPGVTIFANPGARVLGVLSDKVLEVRYIHSANGEAYKHSFKAGVCCELLDDGRAVLYRKDGKPVWDDL